MCSGRLAVLRRAAPQCSRNIALQCSLAWDRLPHCPATASKTLAVTAQAPLDARKCRSGALHDHSGDRKCRSGLLHGHSGARNSPRSHVRGCCSEKFCSVALHSVARRSALPCSVHGYARVHTSYICTCMFMQVPRKVYIAPANNPKKLMQTSNVQFAVNNVQRAMCSKQRAM